MRNRFDLRLNLILVDMFFANQPFPNTLIINQYTVKMFSCCSVQWYDTLFCNWLGTGIPLMPSLTAKLQLKQYNLVRSLSLIKQSLAFARENSRRTAENA